MHTLWKRFKSVIVTKVERNPYLTELYDLLMPSVAETLERWFGSVVLITV